MLQKTQTNFLANPIHRKKKLSSLRKEENPAIFNNMDEPWGCYIKSEKPAMEKVYDSTFMKYLNQI